MFTIRDANLSDITSIASLHAESWQRTYRGIYSDEFLDQEVIQDRLKVWQERLTASAPNQQVIVAVQDTTLFGFACLFLDHDPIFGSLLDNLHIDWQWQQMGIGKSLLQECAKRVSKYSKDTRLYLWVYASNGSARKVYERLGAIHHETVEQATASGVTVPACRYVWEDVKVLL